MNNTAQYQSSEILPLTSLRFFAALFVFIQHVGIYRSLGAIAVSFFFVLSGAVLTIGYGTKLSHVKDWPSFIFLRVSRLYPIHFVTMLATLLFAIYINYGVPTIGVFLEHLTLTQVYVFSGDRIFSFNGISWSVANELFFYICFPLIVLVLGLCKFNNSCSKPLFGLVVVVSISTLLALSVKEAPVPFSKGWWFLYTFPGFRIFDFLVGVMSGYLIARTRNDALSDKLTGTNWLVLELSAIALFLLTFNCAHFFPWSMQFSTLYLPSLSVLIMTFALSKGPIASLLKNRILVHLGHISYSIFLVHVVVIVVVAWFSQGRTWSAEPYSAEWWNYRLLIFAITIVVSHFTFILIEKPTMAYAKRWSAKRRIIVGLSSGQERNAI